MHVSAEGFTSFLFCITFSPAGLQQPPGCLNVNTSVSVAFVTIVFITILVSQLSLHGPFYFTWEEDLMCLCSTVQWTVLLCPFPYS